MERLEYQGTDTFRFREILNILKVIFVDVIFQALNYIYLRAASGASITNCRSACNVSYCLGMFPQNVWQISGSKNRSSGAKSWSFGLKTHFLRSFDSLPTITEP